MSDAATTKPMNVTDHPAAESLQHATPAAATVDTPVADGNLNTPSHLADGNGVTTLSDNLDQIMQIPVSVKVVLGSASMVISDLARLGKGAIIPLDRKVGEPVDLVVNGRVVARGEIVVLEEDKTRFGISLTELVGS